jgi:hypothetical protein
VHFLTPLFLASIAPVSDIGALVMFGLGLDIMDEVCTMDMDHRQEELNLMPLMNFNISASPFLTSPTASPVLESRAGARPISKRRGKKRSSRACTTCRTRKVRCNIVAHGAPCSNCRHDEVDCVLPLSRRQRSVLFPFRIPLLSGREEHKAYISEKDPPASAQKP